MSEELDVGMKCIKYMLFVSNFMFVMIGLLLLSIGSIIKTIYGDFDFFMENRYFSPATLAVCLGIILLTTSLIGCVGSFKESVCFIRMFALVLSVILVLEIITAITAYSLRSNITFSLRRNMLFSIQFYNDSLISQTEWDFIQERLHCCGVNSAKDYQDLTLNIPKSCFTNDLNSRTIWANGCLNSLAFIISESSLLLGCGAISVAFVQFLGIVFSFMLSKAVRRLKTQNLVEAQQRRQAIYDQMAGNKEEKVTPVLYFNSTPEYTEA